jgi:CheY-like chemotaxis protein
VERVRRVGELTKSARIIPLNVGVSGPALVFVDVGMPDPDGIEATRLIRECPGGKHVVIVALTPHHMT